MEFGILGPLEVLRGGDPVPLPGAKQRALVAALVLHVGEVVTADVLADVLWGEEQPANPRNALQSQVSQLRRALGSDGKGIVVSRPTGYALDVAADAVDAVRFEAGVREGRQALAAGDVDRAASLLREALALWRGPALVEFAGEPFAEAAVSRLEELRLNATEARVEADLVSGRHAEVAHELEALVRSHPLREGLRGWLMLALYRSGRQAEALQVYHDTRQVLDKELGIDPSPELTRRYEELLRHEDQAPAPRAVTAPPTPPSTTDPATQDLPTALSSFVGREEELGRVLELVQNTRLVTLTGPGGVGKSRLATEAAIALQGDPVAEDGIWFVELAAVNTAELVVTQIASSLGLHDQAGASVSGVAGGGGEGLDRVARALRGRRALLVLDNCEHLVDEVASVAQKLLTAASGLTVLCTTQEALGVAGETVWSVPSLSVPADDVRDATDLEERGASALFLARVRERDPDFVPAVEQVPLIAEVCRRLDGIPLALELAAARVRTMGIEELAARLDDRFRILTGRDRSTQPRQRTLRAVVEWSWDLLDPRERALMRRLAVFSAGADLDLVEQVCTDDEVPADDVLDVLEALVDKSVVAVDLAAQPPRYRMLETLRTFGLERLEDAGEGGALRDRHADRMLVLAAETTPRLRGPRQLDAMRALDTVLPDLRTALAWLESSGDVGRGAHLAVELGWYWYLKGDRVDAVRWLSAFQGTTDPRDHALLEVWRGFLSARLGATEAFRGVLGSATATLREHGDDRDIAVAELVAADVAGITFDDDGMEAHLEVARAAATRAGDEVYMASADFVVGHAHVAADRWREAEPWMEKALGRFAAAGDRWGQVQCLGALVSTAEAVGHFETAAAHARRGIELAEELGLGELEAILRTKLAAFHALEGASDGAEAELERAFAIAERLGSELAAANVDLIGGIVALRSGDLDRAEANMRRLLAWLEGTSYTGAHPETLARLGIVAELRGDLDRALELHARACRMALDGTDRRAAAFTLEAAAAGLAAAGRAEDAALLLGAAVARRDAMGLPLPLPEREHVDRAEAAAREALGDEPFAEVFARGQGLADDALPIPGVV